MDNRKIERACEVLFQGDLVVMPTETVYGLAADALQGLAVAKIYELKQRPQFNPLIVHVASFDHAQQWGIFSRLAAQLADRFWHKCPSPLTLVVPLRPDTSIAPLVSAGLKTIAIRVPFHPIALSLLNAYGKPLAAPSANPSTHISPTTALAVWNSFGSKTPFLLDGGACVVGLESTILDLSAEKPVLLRPGATTPEMLEAVLGYPVAFDTKGEVKAPGMMKRHYAPNLPLRLNCLHPQEGEAFLGFGKSTTQQPTLNLSHQEDLSEAAANLFSMLAALDRPPFTGISVMPIPNKGLGFAINDRLRRAAAPVDSLHLEGEPHLLA